MRLYHIRALDSNPNLEAICTTDMHAGWNPDRHTGHAGTGIYCKTIPPAHVTERARLFVFEADTSQFYSIRSEEQDSRIEDFSKTLMTYVVAVLQNSYGDSSTRAPLAAWFPHYRDVREHRKEMIRACERLFSVSDDPLTRFIKKEIKRGDDLFFDFILNYRNYMKSGPDLFQGGICKSTRRSAFTCLLIKLGFDGVIFGGEVEYMNDKESRGMILFNTDAIPVSVHELDTQWTAEFRSTLLANL